jgi:hypothetical protein
MLAWIYIIVWTVSTLIITIAIATTMSVDAEPDTEEWVMGAVFGFMAGAAWPLSWFVWGLSRIARGVYYKVRESQRMESKRTESQR